MNTFAMTDFNGIVREISQDEFFKTMKEQTFGAIVGCALEGRTKKEMLCDFDYDSIEELDSKILETIYWVLSIRDYQYGNKYKPQLTAGKTKALKKLKKLLNRAVI